MEPAQLRHYPGDNQRAAHISLGFANTVVWRASQNPRDLLTGYDSLINFGVENGIIDEAGAPRLRHCCEAGPAVAKESYARAIQLRETVYRLLLAAANRQEKAVSDIHLLNEVLTEACCHLVLADSGDGAGCEWRWADPEPGLETIRWAVVLSTASLLTSPLIARLKSCPGEGCAWLFIDQSRNGLRRWCEMDLCGNRAKVRRHRARLLGMTNAE